MSSCRGSQPRLEQGLLSIQINFVCFSEAVHPGFAA